MISFSVFNVITFFITSMLKIKIDEITFGIILLIEFFILLVITEKKTLTNESSTN